MRRALPVLTALWPAVALASDFSGAGTIYLGIPAMVGGLLVAGLAPGWAPSRRWRIGAALVLLPVVWFGVLLLPDAQALFGSQLAVLGVFYIALLVGLVVLVGRLAFWPPPQESGGDAPSSPGPA